MSRILAALITLLLLPGASNAARPGLFQQSPARNLGVSTSPLWVGNGDLVSFPVSERSESADLNGDGDQRDHVLHVYDTRASKLTNLGLDLSSAMWAPEIGDDFVAFRVPEYELGRDVDGNGRLDEYVVHVFDARQSRVLDLDVPAPRSFIAVGRFLVFWVPKTNVTMLYDVDSGILREVGLPASGGFRTGSRVAFSVVERWADEDLNSDGDLDDRILHVVDVETGAIENTGISSPLVAATDRWVIYVASESKASRDLNGDGDAFDLVVGAYDTVEGRVLNTGLSVRTRLRTLKVTNGRVWIEVYEASQGRGDFNGDGDTSDEVLWWYDLESGASRGTGRALLDGFEAHEDVAALHQWVGSTLHLMVFEAQSGRWIDLGASSGFYWPSDGFIYFTRWELLWGDLNGDGDTRDSIAHVYDQRRGRVRNLGLDHTLGFRIGSRWLALPVMETSQGIDLDGDGIRNSRVMVLVDVPSGRRINTAVPYGGNSVLTDSHFIFDVEEGRSRKDLNGDGDTLDDVAHVLRLRGRQSRSRSSW